MIEYIQKKREQKGFTLVELMVVLLIIGILIAVAVPVFLGARTRAQDNVAKQALVNAARAAAAYFASNGSVITTKAQFDAEEDSYTYTVDDAAPAYNATTAISIGSDSKLRTKSQSTADFMIDIAGGKVGAVLSNVAVPAP